MPPCALSEYPVGHRYRLGVLALNLFLRRLRVRQMTATEVCGAAQERISPLCGRAYVPSSDWPVVVGHTTEPHISVHTCKKRVNSLACFQTNSDYINTRMHENIHTQRGHMLTSKHTECNSKQRNATKRKTTVHARSPTGYVQVSTR